MKFNARSARMGARTIDFVELPFCLPSRLQARGKYAPHTASDILEATGKKRTIFFIAILAK